MKQIKKDRSDKKLTVFGYVRVSTDNQLENYSIDAQMERITAYCKAKDWQLAKIYTDGGYSGGNINRPALRQMLEDMHTTYIDALIVCKLDRLSRSQKDTLMLIEDCLLASGVDFISISENFDTSTPFGRAMIGMLSVFAQLEKDQITERFTIGRIARSKAGFFHGGSTPPHGYDYTNGALEINTFEAAQVAEIFSLFLMGKSVNAIARAMNAQYHNRKWSATAISYILKNKIYIGKVKFNGVDYDGRHTPIISPEQYKETQRLLSERETTHSAVQKTPFRAGYILSSLVFCKHCGARYSANHGYYKCYSRAKSNKKFIKDPNCKNDHWRIEVLDAIVLSAVREITENTVALDALTPVPTARKIDTNKIKQRIGEIERQLAKLIDLYQIGTIPMDILAERIQTLDNEKSALSQLLLAESATPSGKSFLTALQSFQNAFASADTDAQRLLISSLIRRIEIDGRSVEIHWRL